MPFTPAHVAAIIPLRSRFAVTSALVIGSMSPDFEYFARARLVSTISHTLLGVLVFCLPVGIAVFLVARALRVGFALLMPRWLRERMPLEAMDRPWTAIALSIVAGALTHVIWDSFTHRSGWAARALGLNEATVAGLPAYSILQHLSTLVGGLVVAGVLIRYLSRREPQPKEASGGGLRRTFWVAVVVSPALAFAASNLLVPGIGTAIVRAIDAVILVTALFSLAALRRLTIGPAV